ncbi:50S ribosomal protein L29 [Geobacter sp. OR-1]|uniref:50S ribosomal protein L29 n=1 Tax=Geobacter sp. OR-1 TaxID=1266765 RepID=UPI000544030F|nr:50S ribosomal protein L29 [Geobacter sp. OR-1]GAM10957.1 50S ribosomal protein L29 [Geobacter sp. OR-1]
MKVSELRTLEVNELIAKDKELNKELFNLSFQLHTGRLENTAKLAALRKDIARVKTLIRETRVERG